MDHERINEILSTSATQRIQLTKNLSTGVFYLNGQNGYSIRLLKVKGKFIHNMGYSGHDSQDMANPQAKYDFLYPEEALYLVEHCNLLVYMKISAQLSNIPMSIQQCYEHFFTESSRTSLNDYKIYSNLTKLGYICRRPTEDRKFKSSECSSNRVVAESTLGPIISRNDHGKLTETEIYDRLSSYMPKSVDSSFLSELKSRMVSKSEFKHLYDVYLPNKSFKKSIKSRPEHKLYTQSSDATRLKVPKLTDLINLANEDSEPSSHIVAFINQSGGCDVSYYRFNLGQTSIPLSKLQ